MSPDEPTSDDPKNCKRASPLQAELPGLSETNDALGVAGVLARRSTGCANHGGDCCLQVAPRRDAGSISGLGLGLGRVGLGQGLNTNAMSGCGKQ